MPWNRDEDTHKTDLKMEMHAISHCPLGLKVWVIVRLGGGELVGDGREVQQRVCMSGR